MERLTWRIPRSDGPRILPVRHHSGWWAVELITSAGCLRAGIVLLLYLDKHPETIIEKKKIQISIISLLLALVINISAQQSEFPILTGIYLGQKPPGKTPELFTPGIISVDENSEHSAAVFSPDGKEVFWCTNVNWYTDEGRADNLRLYTMKEVDGQWTVPRPAPFVKNIRVERPVFSPDGNYLFLENEGIRWVSTSFIEELKPSHLK